MQRGNGNFSAYGTETPTPGYTLFNAGLGTDITTKKEKQSARYRK